MPEVVAIDVYCSHPESLVKVATIEDPRLVRLLPLLIEQLRGALSALADVGEPCGHPMRLDNDMHVCVYVINSDDLDAFCKRVKDLVESWVDVMG